MVLRWLTQSSIAVLLMSCAPGAPEQLDFAASDSYEQALQLERVSPAEARQIYRALLLHDKSICATGLGEFPCQEEARHRLAILDCPADAQAEPVATHEALAILLQEALRERDRQALVRHAACDFTVGICRSAILRRGTPENLVAELLVDLPTPATLWILEETGDAFALYGLDPDRNLFLELGPSGWFWSGFCVPPR